MAAPCWPQLEDHSYPIWPADPSAHRQRELERFGPPRRCLGASRRLPERTGAEQERPGALRSMLEATGGFRRSPEILWQVPGASG